MLKRVDMPYLELSRQDKFVWVPRELRNSICMASAELGAPCQLVASASSCSKPTLTPRSVSTFPRSRKATCVRRRRSRLRKNRSSSRACSATVVSSNSACYSAPSVRFSGLTVGATGRITIQSAAASQCKPVTRNLQKSHAATAFGPIRRVRLAIKIRFQRCRAAIYINLYL
jgi:hypothetical protein